VDAVLDTNALMMPVELDVRLFEELDRLLGEGHDLLVPEAVLAELSKLASGRGDEAVAASVGVDLATRASPVDHEADYADDAVLEVARRTGAAAVTNDGPLKRRLLDADVPVICIRGRNKLELNRP
jgi:rRNA-processing protein FCF1